MFVPDNLTEGAAQLAACPGFAGKEVTPVPPAGEGTPAIAVPALQTTPLFKWIKSNREAAKCPSINITLHPIFLIYIPRAS